MKNPQSSSADEKWKNDPYYSKSKALLEVAKQFAGRSTTETRKEKWLKSNAWWWNFLPESSNEEKKQNDARLKKLFGFDTDGCYELRVILDLHFKRSAFVYEMLMRMEFPGLIPAPWPSALLRDQPTLRWEFEKMFPASTKCNPILMFPGVDGYIDPPKIFGPRFSDFYNVAFNLDCHDTILIKEFKGFLAEQRFKRNIPAPKTNQYQRHRETSWKPIELCDIERFEIRTLNGSERSQLHKAKVGIFSFLS